MPRLITAALLFILSLVPAWAEAPVPQLMAERLQAGELALLEQDLTARLAAQPADGQARLALGTVQFLRTVEGLAQDMYRHGLQPPRDVAMMLPFFRFPLPPNPRPEPLDYEKMRAIFKRALAGFEQTDQTLSAMGEAEVKLPIAIAQARLDLDGNGTADAQESLFAVFNATLAGGNMPPEAAEASPSPSTAEMHHGSGAMPISSARFSNSCWRMTERRASTSARHMLFPGAGLPNAELNPQPGTSGDTMEMGPAADLLAAIHLMHWQPTEPERMKAALPTSKRSWR